MTSTDQKKWTVDPLDIPGPRQVKSINRAISRLRSAGKGEKIIEGVHGQPDTYRKLLSITGMMTAERNPLSIEREETIGKAADWTISKRNANATKKALAAAAAEVDATIPTTDNRISPEDYAEKMRQQSERHAKAAAEQEARDEKRTVSHAAILAKRPPGAAALIVAELQENQSDIMTDHFAHRTIRYVAIGWRTGSRESFAQLRKAALGFPKTEHLGQDAEKEVEHRENYSMGGGNYVKEGGRHSSGWAIRSYPLTDSGELPRYGLQELEDGIPDKVPQQASEGSQPSEGSQGNAYRISEETNKRGQFWLVVQDQRVDRTEFERLRDSAKVAGGWYSRKWGKCPGGFEFSDKDSAEAWAAGEFGADAPPPPTPGEQRDREAERLETLADGMQADIDNKRAPLSQNWTPRRGTIKDGQRLDADRLADTQQGLRAIAAALRTNTLPPGLARVNTKKAVGDLLSAYPQTAADDRILASLQELIAGTVSDADREAEQERQKALALEKLEDQARTRNVAGFFPTPPAVVDRMIEAAGVDLTAPASSTTPRYNFLEPSAGIGSIADALRPYVERNGGGLVLCEIAPDLCEILKAKGYDSAPGCSVVCRDFLEREPFAFQGEPVLFDRVLMNPPFERKHGLSDVRHVARALAHLAPGGRLVALMTPRGAAEAEEAYSAAVEELPEGSFTGKDAFRQTGVSVRLVVIDKAEAA